jgi:hypothetical protein
MRNTYCQKYKICHESKCECAWGCEGSECDSECEKKHWGLSCNNTCQEECENCNNITGECPDSVNIGKIIGITFGVILLLIGIIVFVVVKRKSLWNQYLKWRYHGISNTEHISEDTELK